MSSVDRGGVMVSPAQWVPGEGTQARLLAWLTTDRRGMSDLACVCRDAVSRPLFKVRIATDLGLTWTSLAAVTRGSPARHRVDLIETRSLGDESWRYVWDLRRQRLCVASRVKVDIFHSPFFLKCERMESLDLSLQKSSGEWSLLSGYFCHCL